MWTVVWWMDGWMNGWMDNAWLWALVVPCIFFSCNYSYGVFFFFFFNFVVAKVLWFFFPSNFKQVFSNLHYNGEFLKWSQNVFLGVIIVRNSPNEKKKTEFGVDFFPFLYQIFGTKKENFQNYPNCFWSS